MWTDRRRPGPSPQVSPDLGQGGVVFLHPGDDQPGPSGRCHLGRRVECEQVRARRHAPTAQDALAPVEHHTPTGALVDRSRRAQLVGRMPQARPHLWPDSDGTSPVGSVTVRTSRVGAGQHAVTQTSGHPGHQPATPAMERPKLASIKAKSVKMSPPKASGNKLRLWNDAERGLTRLRRPASTSTR